MAVPQEARPLTGRTISRGAARERWRSTDRARLLLDLSLSHVARTTDMERAMASRSVDFGEWCANARCELERSVGHTCPMIATICDAAWRMGVPASDQLRIQRNFGLE